MLSMGATQFYAEPEFWFLNKVVRLPGAGLFWPPVIHRRPEQQFKRPAARGAPEPA